MKALSVWIWFIGGVIIGIIVFSVFIKLISLVAQGQQQEDAKKVYENIVTSVNGYCDVREGMAMTPRIVFPNIVTNIYASTDKKNPNYEGNVTIGNYICMNISNVVTCKWVSCEAEMMMLEKKEQLLSFIDRAMGRTGNTEYTLELRRTECGVALLELGMKSICSPCDLDKADKLIFCQNTIPVLLTYDDIVLLADLTPWIAGKDGMKKLAENVANYLKGKKILVVWEDDNSDPENETRKPILNNLQGLGFDITLKRHTETLKELENYDQIWLLNPGWCDYPGRKKDFCKNVEMWTDSEISELKDVKIFIITDADITSDITTNTLNRILKEKRFNVMQLPQCKCDCGKGWVETIIVKHELTKGLSKFEVNAVASIGCV